MLKIAGSEFNWEKMATEVYIAGCNPPHCEGCHNPELWDVNENTLLLDKHISGIEKMVWVLGGEPCDRPKPVLKSYLSRIRELAPNAEIVLFTRREEVDDDIKEMVDYIKYGAYDCNKPPVFDEVLGVTLASNNQKVVKCGKNL